MPGMLPRTARRPEQGTCITAAASLLATVFAAARGERKVKKKTPLGSVCPRPCRSSGSAVPSTDLSGGRQAKSIAGYSISGVEKCELFSVGCREGS